MTPSSETNAVAMIFLIFQLLFVECSQVAAARALYLLPPGPCSGAGKNRSSRTSPTASQEMEPLRAHASTSCISEASTIHNPPMCSFFSKYGPSVTSPVPSDCFLPVLALAAEEMPQANFLTPAA